MKRLAVILLSGMLAGCVTETTIPEKEVQPPEVRAQLHAQLAANYLQRNQLEIALDEVDKALKLEPNNLSANYIMALLRLRFKEPDQADSYFRKASGRSADGKTLPNAQHDYANFLCQRKEYRRADNLYQEVIDNPLYPSQDRALLNRGECFMAQGRYEEAEKYLRQALKANPRQVGALYQMTRISFRTGTALDTRAWYQRYLEVGEDRPEILYIAYQTEKTLGDKDAAASLALLLKGMFPDSKEAALLRKNR